MELSKSVTLLSALAQQSRLQIFRQLVQAGPTGLTPTQLTKLMQMPPATLSFHLKELHHSNLIQREKHGRSITYSARYDVISELIEFLQEDCCLLQEDCCNGSSCS